MTNLSIANFPANIVTISVLTTIISITILFIIINLRMLEDFKEGFAVVIINYNFSSMLAIARACKINDDSTLLSFATKLVIVTFIVHFSLINLIIMPFFPLLLTNITKTRSTQLLDGLDTSESIIISFFPFHIEVITLHNMVFKLL